MKNFLLLVIGLLGVSCLRGKTAMRGKSVTAIKHVPSPAEFKVNQLVTLFSHDGPDALFKSELMLDEIRNDHDPHTQELRVRLLIVQARMYYATGDRSSAIEKIRDAGSESWLLPDGLQKSLSVEIGRNYDTYVESAVDRIKRKLAAAERAMQATRFEDAVSLAEDAYLGARSDQVANHQWASRALAAQGFAEYELGQYEIARQHLNAAHKQLDRFWGLLTPAYKDYLQSVIRLCRRN